MAGSDSTEDIRVFHNMIITAYFASDAGEFTSGDEMVNILIPEETTALDGKGDPLTDLEFVVNGKPPPLPPETSIVGQAYNLEPSGATFDPPVTVIWGYEPAGIPYGVAEEGLVIAYYDEAAGEWVELQSVVDTSDNAITAQVEHFTTFAVFASTAPASPPKPAGFTLSSLYISPLEVNAGESVIIGVLVTNTGGEAGSCIVDLKINGVIEEANEITLDGGASEMVTFATCRDEADTYSVDVNGLTGLFMVREVGSPVAAPSPDSPSGVNWSIFIPVMIVVVFLAIFLPIRLRRGREYHDW